MNKGLYKKTIERIEVLKEQYKLEELKMNNARERQKNTLERLYELYLLLNLDEDSLHKEGFT